MLPTYSIAVVLMLITWLRQHLSPCKVALSPVFMLPAVEGSPYAQATLRSGEECTHPGDRVAAHVI